MNLLDAEIACELPIDASSDETMTLNSDQLIPCPRCRDLCPPETERCARCGCPVRQITEQRRRLARAVIISVVVLFLLLLADSIYWATKL